MRVRCTFGIFRMISCGFLIHVFYASFLARRTFWMIGSMQVLYALFNNIFRKWVSTFPYVMRKILVLIGSVVRLDHSPIRTQHIGYVYPHFTFTSLHLNTHFWRLLLYYSTSRRIWLSSWFTKLLHCTSLKLLIFSVYIRVPMNDLATNPFVLTILFEYALLAV